MGSIKQLRSRVKKFAIKRFPHVVYFLCQNDEVVYVGQSRKFTARMQNHLDDRDKTFNMIYYMVVDPSMALLVESAFIKYYKPAFNFNTNLVMDRKLTLAEKEVLKQYSIALNPWPHRR